jgi:ABC-type nitrate/sulfonate/bicarbonate transport systems, periplasmic components
MTKKLSLLIILVGILVLPACSKADNNGTTPSGSKDTTESALKTSGQELNIGILPAESAIPIILAKEKGFFDEAGIKVSIKSFSSPNDRNVAVQAKELDAAVGDVMTAATFVDKGIPVRITSDISEDFKILSSPGSGITKMEQLRGKRISLVPNFILEYIMDQFAAKYGFDYQIVEIPSFAGRSEALMSNQIDSVVFTEPQAGMLVKQGAHLLGSSKEAGIKGGALFFTDDLIANRPGDIKAFYQAYNKAVDYMNKTDVKEYSGILSKYQFPDAIGDYLSGMEGTFAYAGTIGNDQFDSIVKWTKDKGQISKLYTYDDLTDFSFIKQ